jgi:prolyl oligopeptidase
MLRYALYFPAFLLSTSAWATSMIPPPVLPVDDASAAVQTIAYPITRSGDVAEVQFGEKIADPYRWLENDVREDGEVAQWVAAQNKLTNAYLETLPGRKKFAERLTQLFNYERIGTPRKAGTRYFYMRNNGLQNQSTLHVREGISGSERMLIDPNEWAKDGATALAEWSASHDGGLLLYAVQDGGSDWRTLKIIDAASGKRLDDEVKWVKFSGLSWAKDGSGFYYSRFAEPVSGAAFQSLNHNQTIYFHRIGTPQSADVKVFATPDHPKRGHGAQVTDDGRYLVVTSSQGTDDRYEIHVGRIAKDGRAKLKPLITGLNYNWELAGSVGSEFYFLTNKGAPRGRLVKINVAKGAREKEIVTTSAATMIGASLIGERLIVAYLGDAKSEAELRDLDGKLVAPIKLPGLGTAGGFGGKAGDSETFYSYSSFATPSTVYRFDTRTGKTDVWAAPKVAFNPADYVTDQQFYPSKDGTKIPIFIVRKKTTRPGAPALLYGYGGFNISQTPGFSATRLAWVDKGGVLAIANLRGGGEYGKDWHDAGRLSKKQNVFDDFIAAGEYLIAQGISAPGKLAIEGRSNGGLLVGAVINQRPDLFAAALPAVGVMDMLRFNRFTAGRYWVDDYGDPGVETDFKMLRSYSPYHNIRAGKPYPAIMVMTADTDDRVVPGHSFKYAAALQAVPLGEKPRLIRIETRAGHGSGKPTDKIIAEFSDAYAFIAKWTGLDVE